MLIGFLGDWMGDMVVSIVRSFIWFLTSAALHIMDGVYEISSKLAGMDIGNNKLVWSWLSGLMWFVGLFVFVRVCSIGFQVFFDEEAREKYKSGDVISRIIPLCLAMAFVPIGTKLVTSMGTYAVKNVSVFLSTEPNVLPSSVIVTSTLNQKNSNGTLKEIKLKDVDISKKEDGKFTYFSDTTDLFILLFVACLGLFGFVMNAIMIAKRFYSMGVKILISPYPISGIIVPGDESFKTWIRMMISDILSNFIQFLMLYFVIAISTAASIRTEMGMWGTIVMFIAGILTVLSGVPELARLIGGDTSTGSVLQQVAALRQSTAGAASFVGSAVGGVVGGAATLGAFGTVGLGKRLGGARVADVVSGAGAAANVMGDAMSSAVSSTFKGSQNTNRSSNKEHGIPKGETQHEQSTMQSRYGSDMAMAKDGSLAKRFADFGYENSGKRATGARMASYGGRHLYEASARRVADTGLWKGFNSVRNSASKNPYFKSDVSNAFSDGSDYGDSVSGDKGGRA